MDEGRPLHRAPLDADPDESVALDEARALARGHDVRLGGGVRTVREFLHADLVDHLHLVIVPIVLGRGQRLWDGLEGFEARFDIQIVPGDGHVTHLIATRANNHEDLGGHHA